MYNDLSLHPSRYPEMCVNIRKKTINDGRIRVIGTAMRAEDETEYPDIASYTTKPVSKKRLNSAVMEAVAAIEAKYYEVYGDGKLTKASVCAAFDGVRSDVGQGLRLQPTWKAKSTNEMAISFFERNTLLLLMPYLLSDRPYLAEDREKLESEMNQICLRHGSATDTIARENAAKHLKNAEIILSHMRDRDSRIPDLPLSSPEYRVRARREEQIKMLPIPVLLAFYRKVRALVPEMPKRVFFAVLVSYGLRPAEAAGTKPSDISWGTDHCAVMVAHQEVDGRITDHLKNTYSKRIVIISYWGMVLLRQCCDLIGDNYPADGTAMIMADECADWVKGLLIEAGATDTQLDDIGGDITEEDMDDSSIDPSHPAKGKADRTKKIGCYVLRRCFTTIMRVYMGLSLYETDRMLGHIPHGSGKNKASKSGHPDLVSPETQHKIAAKMERYVFDKELTRNPKYDPYQTSGKESIALMAGYVETTMENDEDEDIILDLDLTASEQGICLSLEYNGKDCAGLHATSVPVSYDNTDRTVFASNKRSYDE